MLDSNTLLLARCSRFWFRRCLRRQVESENPAHRSLDVAVIGAPNVGKSLLSNQLVRAAVSAVSSRMDTTTHNVDCIITEGEVQLCLVDSPGTIGLGHAKKRMKNSPTPSKNILSHPEIALTRAQHILVVQDATATGDYIHHRVMHLLHRNTHLTSSLVINKVDLITDRTQLLELTRILTDGVVGGKTIETTANTIGRLGTAKKEMKLHDTQNLIQDEAWLKKYREVMSVPTHKVPYMDTKRLFMNIRGWKNFDSVFFVSSLSGEGIDALREHLKNISEKREWRNDEMSVTTRNPKEICIESVRAALLDTTPSDVAYRIKPKILEWGEEGEVLQIVVDLPVDKEREGRLLVGPGGKRIVSIAMRVNDHLQSLFQRQLFVRILVKHKGKIIDVPRAKNS